MCAFCGPAPANPGWFDAGIPDGLPARLRARETVMRVARAVADPRAVGVRTQPGGAAVSVTTPDGRSSTLTDFGALWATVETLSGHTVTAVGQP